MMRSYFIALLVMSFWTISGQTDGTIQQKENQCEVVTRSGEGKLVNAAIDCKFLEYHKLDVELLGVRGELSEKGKTQLDTEVLPLLQQGFRVEIASDYTSRRTSSENKTISIRRAIRLAQHLSQQGIDDDYFLIRGNGDTAGTTGFSFRVIPFEEE
ncbi:MAG: hypothetical protein AAF466_06655 [Bacteroidota bacterium]